MAYADQAAAAANAVFGGQEASLKSQQQLAQARIAAEQAALQQFQGTGTQAINQSFEGLLSELSRNRAGAIQGINQAANQMAQNYNQGFETAGLAQQASRDYIEQMAQRIGGVSFADRAPLDQLAQEQTFNRINEINRNRAQAELAGFGQWGQQQDVAYGRTEENARGAQAQRVSGFQSDLANKLQESMLRGQEIDVEALNALMQLGSEKGRFGLDYGTKLAQMDMQAQEANARLAQQAAELQLRREAQAFEQQMAQQGPSAWDREKFYASLGLDQRKQNFTEQSWAAEFGNQPPDVYSGRQGMEEYLRDINRNPGLADWVDRAAAYASTSPNYMGQPITSALINDQYKVLQALAGNGSFPQIDPELWSRLVAIQQGQY